nr:hypothetical protein B0A51_17868 [Rachicladosporium sp. CCFEE 5018]
MDHVAEFEASAQVPKLKLLNDASRLSLDGLTRPDEGSSTDHGAPYKGRYPTSLKRYLPCDYFDFIGGTSTGGLIAIMLGRLRMSVDECLTEYNRIGTEVFAKPRLFDKLTFGLTRQPRFKHQLIERAFMDLVTRRAGERSDAPCMSSESGPKTFVLASELYDGGQRLAVLLTLLDSMLNPSQAVSLFGKQPGQQTAAPMFFSPLRHGNATFVDGGISVNNPTIEAITEVEHIVGRQKAAAGSTGETDIIKFERDDGSDTGAALCFRRQRLACLHEYLGGPV